MHAHSVEPPARHFGKLIVLLPIKDLSFCCCLSFTTQPPTNSPSQRYSNRSCQDQFNPEVSILSEMSKEGLSSTFLVVTRIVVRYTAGSYDIDLIMANPCTQLSDGRT